MSQRNQRFDEYGHEVLSDEEIIGRTRLRTPASHVMRMRNMIRQELSQRAEQAGQESFEEADDFEIPEGEGDWVSPYEELFEPPLEAAPRSPAQPTPAQPVAPAAPTAAVANGGTDDGSISS